jgi:hypothetical protein
MSGGRCTWLMETRKHGAESVVRHGLLLASQIPLQAPSQGVSAGRGPMPLPDDGLCRRGEVHPLGRDGEADQQFGRTRERERAGSTGRAGCARAGEPLVCLFFMGALLVCGSLTHARYAQQRTNNSTLILRGWSGGVNAPPCGTDQLGQRSPTLPESSARVIRLANSAIHMILGRHVRNIPVGQRTGPRDNDFVS